MEKQKNSAVRNRLVQDLNMPEAFIPGSREAQLRQMCRALEQEGMAAIVGPAGMGKTALAVEAAKRLETARGACRIQYSGSMRETLENLRFAEGKSGSWRANLRRLKEECRDWVLIIDDFDGRGKSARELRQDSVLRELLNAGVKLVFTGEEAHESLQPVALGPLDMAHRLALLRQHAPQTTEQELEPLAAVAGGNTLVLSLTARLLGQQGKARTCEELLAVLDGAQTPGEAAKRLLKLAAPDCKTQQALTWAAYLPGGMDRELFLRCLPQEAAEEVRELTALGWLCSAEGDAVAMHGLLRALVRQELRPHEDEYRTVAEHIRSLTGLGEGLAAIYGEQADRKPALKDQLEPLARWMEAALADAQDPQGDFALLTGRVWGCAGKRKAETACLRRALRARRELRPEDTARLAEVQWHLGESCVKTMDKDRGIIHLEEALARMEQGLVPPENMDRIYYAMCCHYRSVLQMRMVKWDRSSFDRAEECGQKALELARKYHAEDLEFQAEILEELASLYYWLGEGSDSLLWGIRGYRDYRQVCSRSVGKEQKCRQKAMELWQQVPCRDNRHQLAIYGKLRNACVMLKNREGAVRYGLLREELLQELLQEQQVEKCGWNRLALAYVKLELAKDCFLDRRVFQAARRLFVWEGAAR